MMLGICRTGTRSKNDMRIMLSHSDQVKQIDKRSTWPSWRIHRVFQNISIQSYLVNNPYKIFFAEDEYTCSVADFTGTFKGAMKGLDGKMIQPTNKRFHLEFCTVAYWKNGKILEERLFYGQVGMLKQIRAIHSN